MTATNITIPMGHINLTGIQFMTYAKRYRRAALSVRSIADKRGFDPVPYQLFCQSLELHLKSFIWAEDQVNANMIKNRYRHNIEKLWLHAKNRGVHKYISITPLREQVISLVGPYYRDKKLCYLDFEMAQNGFQNLRSEPRIISTLSRLTKQLEIKLRQPILKAS